jgi:hypothetical protein
VVFPIGFHDKTLCSNFVCIDKSKKIDKIIVSLIHPPLHGIRVDEILSKRHTELF